MTSLVNIVNINNLSKIENFFNDSAYREIIENSETFNTRLCIERRLRIPFLDAQTRVAQINSVKLCANQRIPGLREGQVYSYPAARWRKTRRQYLLQRPFPSFPQYSRPFGHLQSVPDNDNREVLTELLPSIDNDSRDSQKDSQEWYYDDMDMHEMEAYDEPEPLDSDCDYEETSYRSKKRGPRGRGASGSRAGGFSGFGSRGKSTGGSEPLTTPKRGRGGRSGRGRKPMDNKSATTTITDNAVDKRKSISVTASSPQPIIQPIQEDTIPPILVPELKLPEDLEEKLLHKAGTSHKVLGSVIPATLIEKGKAPPSPYCDFCLGDARENRKTMEPEELVSCSDCGRSGHPTCLQFTDNMIISVRKYRWQCIECKYCTICGTSDNDDQLLFCDDCDRGYHMYCLSPPLNDPPEGSWSCRLCYEEFHKNK